jgi:hypothetical protein
MRLTFWEAKTRGGAVLRAMKKADVVADAARSFDCVKYNSESYTIKRRSVNYRDALWLFENWEREESNAEYITRRAWIDARRVREGVDAAGSLLEARAIVNGITAD